MAPQNSTLLYENAEMTAELNHFSPIQKAIYHTDTNDTCSNTTDDDNGTTTDGSVYLQRNKSISKSKRIHYEQVWLGWACTLTKHVCTLSSDNLKRRLLDRQLWKKTFQVNRICFCKFARRIFLRTVLPHILDSDAYTVAYTDTGRFKVDTQYDRTYPLCIRLNRAWNSFRTKKNPAVDLCVVCHRSGTVLSSIFVCQMSSKLTNLKLRTLKNDQISNLKIMVGSWK